MWLLHRSQSKCEVCFRHLFCLKTLDGWVFRGKCCLKDVSGTLTSQFQNKTGLFFKLQLTDADRISRSPCSGLLWDCFSSLFQPSVQLCTANNVWASNRETYADWSQNWALVSIACCHWNTKLFLGIFLVHVFAHSFSRFWPGHEFFPLFGFCPMVAGTLRVSLLWLSCKLCWLRVLVPRHDFELTKSRC